MRFVLVLKLTLLLSACLPQGFWPEKGTGEGVLGEGYDVQIISRDVTPSEDTLDAGSGNGDVKDIDASVFVDVTAFADAGPALDANALSVDASAPADVAIADVSAPDVSAFGEFGSVFMEINYVSSSFATTPGRLYSDTEGWREPQWAPEPDSYRDFPEVWDIFDGIEIQNNPWGQGADIDGNDRLQWMFGLEELSQTGTVTLEIWGSGDFGSSTTIDVTNPLFGCGETVEVPFNPDDELLLFTIDMTDCVQPGEGVQAIRVENGIRAFSLQRMRLTLSDAR